MWDFTKIPDHEWESIAQGYKDKDYVKLVKIHNKYNVSPYDYCCREKGFYKWIKKAIEWKTEEG